MEVLGYICWIGVIVASYYLTAFAIKIFEKKQQFKEKEV